MEVKTSTIGNSVAPKIRLYSAVEIISRMIAFLRSLIFWVIIYLLIPLSISS
jgi:hypothetical protein